MSHYFMGPVVVSLADPAHGVFGVVLAKIKNPRPVWNGGRPARGWTMPQAASVDYDDAKRNQGIDRSKHGRGS